MRSSRTVSWARVAAIGIVVSLISAAAILAFQPKFRPLPVQIVLFAIVPAFALFVDRYATSALTHLGPATRLNGNAPSALLIPLRSARTRATALALFSLGLGTYVSVATALRPKSGFDAALMYGIATVLMVSSLPFAFNRRRLGFELTPTALRSIGVFRDVYVPWEALHGVVIRKSAGTGADMVLEVSPGKAIVGGVIGLIRPGLASATYQWRTSTAALSEPAETVIVLVERLRADADARAQLGSASSLRLLPPVSPPPFFPFADSDGQWFRRLVTRSILTSPIVVVAILLFGTVLKSADPSTRFPGGISFAMVMGALVTPFLYGPASRSRFIQDLGCRRSALFFVVPVALSALAIGIVAVASQIGLPVF